MLIGFVFWYRGLAQGGVAAVGQLQLLQPFMGLALAGLLLGEAPAQTLTRATAIAAQAVTQVGFGIRDREQLARLEAAVQLTEQQEGCR